MLIFKFHVKTIYYLHTKTIKLNFYNAFKYRITVNSTKSHT